MGGSEPMVEPMRLRRNSGGLPLRPRGPSRPGNWSGILHAIIDEGRKAHVHTVIARIADGNGVSIHLHESMGFRHIGVMREVGRKFGRLLDVYLMQLIYTG